MDNSKNMNFNNESTKNKILLPHKSRLNNFKSNKYFFNDQKNSSIKEALMKYIENSQKNDKNESLSKSNPSSNSTIDISNINQTKKKFNKNNTIKFDKSLINFAEPRTKAIEFHKIEPKVIDSFFLDNEDNMNSFFDNDINKESIKEEINSSIKNNSLKYNNISSQIYNKTIKMQNNKTKKKCNLNITDTNDNEETIINENDFDENESFYDEFENTKKQIKTLSNNMELNFKKINIEYLIIFEKLYNELKKDLEVNEMDIYQNKLTIIKDFIIIFNDKNNSKLFNIIETIALKLNNNIGLAIKEYLILQLIFFYIIILIGLINKEKNNYHSGLLNLSFYFHQSLIILIYIIIINIEVNSNYSPEDLEIINNIKICLKILEENKTWLDKNNYEKYLQTNNNLSMQILINLLNQLKIYFNSNSSISKKNNNNFVEECINLFLLYLKSYHNLKIINIIKEINNSFPINELLDTIKFDKIISHFSQDNQKSDMEEFKIEENTDKEEMPKEPFLKPINPKYKYTLVLDLDETLVHYIPDNDTAYIQIRPGAEEFLKDLSEYYEIIIFTAAIKNYADRIIDAIDPDKFISDRLYRQHTKNIGNINIKDLSKLGRNLKHVIIIDNCMENYSFQQKNGLNIIDFEGNEFDDELEYLKEDLIKLAKINPDDVRDYLENIQADMDKRAIYFLKMINEGKNKDELLNYNDNYYKNSLFNEIINNKINEEDNLKDKKNRKGYSFTEESENVADDKI